MLLADVLRIWLPSLITIYGQAGDTPAEQMGAFALAWFLAGMLTVPLARRVGPNRTALIAGIVLAAGRVVLQFAHGGDAQLYTASIALLAGIGWLTATAMAGVPKTARGLSAGLAAAVTVHAMLRTVDLVWRTGVLGWLLTLIEIAVFLIVLPRSERVETPAAVWFGFGPALLLTGILTGSPSRAEAAVQGLGLLVVAGAWLGVLLASGYRLTRRPYAAAVALIVLVGLAALPHLSAWTVLAQALAAAALGACLGWADSGRPAIARRRGFAASGGMLVLFLLAFGYYAAYDISYGFPNVLFLLLAAVLVAVAVRREHVPGVFDRLTAWRVLPAALVSLLLAATALLSGTREAGRTGMISDVKRLNPSVRIVTYNVRMGFDLDGKYAVPEAVRAIKSQRPDVVALNEVDRGWFLNGGHDVAARFSAELHMPYVFAPAADDVWGDVILSRYPVVRTHHEKISPSDAPTGAGVLTAELDLDGATLNVVATHLQPGADGKIPVAEAAKANAAAHQATGPTVLLGDMNAEPGSPQFAALSTGLTDGLAAHRPVYTFPSDRPDQQIDQVFVSTGITTSAIAVPHTTASDHRPVAITLTWS